MIITFRHNGHHHLYDQTLRHWAIQGQNILAASAKILHQSLLLGRWLRGFSFWEYGNHLWNSPFLFFSYWDDVIPVYLPASWRLALCPKPVGAIWMNTWGFRRPGSIQVSSWGRYSFLKDPHLSFAILDEEVLDHLATLPPKDRPKARLHWMPDFTSISFEDADEGLVRAVLDFANGRNILLSVGVQNGFKNLGLLARVAQYLDPRRWVVAVIGEAEDEVGIRLLEEASRQHIFVHKGRVGTEGTLNTLIRRSSLVWGAYRHWEGSSNIQIKAGLLRKPILCLEGFLMADRNRRYRLGFQGTAEELLAMAQQQFSIVGDYNPNEASLDEFARVFSLENAQRHFEAIYNSVKDRSESSLIQPGMTRLAARGLVRLGRIYGHLKGFGHDRLAYQSPRNNHPEGVLN